MHGRIFEVVPHGDGWSILSHGEPLIVTRSKASAQRLAHQARMSLQDTQPDRVYREPRSFQPREEG